MTSGGVLQVTDIINGALRLLGVLAAQEQASANESENALISLNNMIDAWGTQKNLTKYYAVQETFAMIPNQQTYAMGKSGTPDFNTVRPIQIENIIWQQIQGSTIFQITIPIITQDEWSRLTVPSVTSNIETKCWVNYTYPNVTLNFWPIPLTNNNVVFYSWKPFTPFTWPLINSTVTFPPGYAKAMIWNLAIDLAPEYGKQPSSTIVDVAISTLAAIKRVNMKPQLLGQDVGVISKKPGFNWLTGE